MTMREFIADPANAIVVSAVVSSAVTWFFAWIYYWLAGRQLRAEAKALHIAASGIAYRLEHPDHVIEFRRDDAGRITGWYVATTGRM